MEEEEEGEKEKEEGTSAITEIMRWGVLNRVEHSREDAESSIH